MSSSSSVSTWRSDTTDRSSGIPNEDDPVIPSPSQVGRIFAESKYLWQGLFARAGAMTMQCDTVRLLDLGHRVPPMPDNLQSMCELAGQAMWRMESASCTSPPHTRTKQTRKWALTRPRPTLCTISKRSWFPFSDTKSNGVSLLFFGWTYILCMKLLEKQHLDMKYTTRLPPTSRQSESSSQLDDRWNTVDIGIATEAEIQWWNAILAPGQGWRPATGQQSVWAISYNGNIKFRVSAKVEPAIRSTTSFNPPSSAEAVSFLSKFASIYNLQGQASLALAMALTLPLHGEINSTVQLPKPLLVRDGIQSPCPSIITDEYDNLSRYMTLSSKPAFLSSTLWSTFWEPGVDSNLVSPWCDPIIKVIKPLIDRDDLERLGHLMALRRPNLAPLWYGVTACGQTKIIKAIIPFLEKLQTPMVSRPIPEVAAWTRSPQSFMDLSGSGPYINQETGEVSRADVWRLRHECWDAEPEGMCFRNPPFSPWPPFGSIPVDELELPVRAHVSCARHLWAYSRWTWFLGDETEVVDEMHANEDAWPELDRNINPSQVLPEYLPPLGYTPDNVASEMAVGAIFRWSATEMEATGKDIYTHPWVDALADLELWEDEDIKDSRGSARIESSSRCDLEHVKGWVMRVEEKRDLST
ncbi:hypothetical protein V8F33_013945 [Rhypophila sp. PSN 637]